MRGTWRIAALSGVAAGLTACLTLYHPRLTDEGELVTVYDGPEAVPEACTAIKEVQVTDGNDNYYLGRVYDGTYEQAIVRLRNTAASMDADAVAILPYTPDYVILKAGDEETVVTIRARVYRCRQAPA